MLNYESLINVVAKRILEVGVDLAVKELVDSGFECVGRQKCDDTEARYLYLLKSNEELMITIEKDLDNEKCKVRIFDDVDNS